MTTTPARMQQRRRTLAQWTAENPVLAAGEIAQISDSPQGGSTGNAWKLGNGVTLFNNLTLNAPVSGFSIGANAMHSTAAYSVTSGFPRLVFPDAATTDAYVTLGVPSYWTVLSVGFDWTNDHTATGNVRWQFTLRGNDVGGVITTVETNNVVTSTLASPAANGGHITNIMQTDLAVTHGAFGTLWALQMTRLGGDGADTLAGSVGLMEVVIIRGNGI